jgi:hypothetical protein
MGAWALFDTNPQNRGSNPTNLEDDYQDFVCSVANSADRAIVAGVRRRFSRLYGDWFPPFEADADLHPQKAYYREVIDWWKTGLAELSLEEPDEQFGLHVVILRRKLRVIWLLASSGDQTEANYRIGQLSTHYYRNYCLDLREQDATKLKRLSGACHWLGKHLNNLKVCQNPQCEQLTKYFVHGWGNRKYCSPSCSQEADKLRRQSQSQTRPPKAFKRSPEARERMSQSATERWEQVRNASGLKRGEQPAKARKPSGPSE